MYSILFSIMWLVYAGWVIMCDCSKNRAHKSESIFLKKEHNNEQSNPLLIPLMNDKADSCWKQRAESWKSISSQARLQRVLEANWQYRRGGRNEGEQGFSHLKDRDEEERRNRDAMNWTSTFALKKSSVLNTTTSLVPCMRVKTPGLRQWHWNCCTHDTGYPDES